MHQQRFVLCAASLLVLAACTTGCVSLAANLIGVIQGNNRPAEFEGLEDKSVAIVCTCDGDNSIDSVSTMLSSYIEANLNTNVEDIDVIRQAEVERWLGSHGRSDRDYVEIGRGVDAERLVAVEVMNLTLRNGATLFRGQADIMVTVYDIPSGGKILFKKQIPEYAFPKMGGPSVTDTTEAKFRGLFLTVLADKISRLFYESEVGVDFALDATSNTF
ncbi:MAG: hypothetical protein KDB22_19295 [Planctomycetales bacterium]|nr:hypothetical protein [Planctomycetales bacterium]